MADDGAGGHSQFQIVADVSAAAFKHVVAYIEVLHESPKDGSPRDLVVVPVIQSGETLWRIAQQHYGNGNLYHRLLAANPSITNPNLIQVGDLIRVPRS